MPVTRHCQRDATGERSVSLVKIGVVLPRTSCGSHKVGFEVSFRVDPTERLAEKYLRELNIGDVRHEPDGNVPPDFVIGGRIAVEVRRLNQNYVGPDGYEGLESLEAGLLRFIENELPKFGPPEMGKSWWVFWQFSRPLDMRALKRDLPRALEKFARSDATRTVTKHIGGSFQIEFSPANIPLENFLAVGGYSDLDSGGAVASEIIRNLNLCIAEKTDKVHHYRSRYPQWWLVFTDLIYPQLSPSEREKLRDHISNDQWDRIVLLDPTDPRRALQLWPK